MTNRSIFRAKTVLDKDTIAALLHPYDEPRLPSDMGPGQGRPVSLKIEFGLTASVLEIKLRDIIDIDLPVYQHICERIDAARENANKDRSGRSKDIEMLRGFENEAHEDEWHECLAVIKEANVILKEVVELEDIAALLSQRE